MEALDEEESKVPIDLDRIVITKYRPRVEGLMELDFTNIDIDKVPEKAVLVDTRDREEYNEWHLPGAIHIDDLKPKPGETYVFYCSSGKSSRLVAAYYRWRGYKAFSLKGGVYKSK